MIYFVQRTRDNAIKIGNTKLLSKNTITALTRSHGEVVLLGWTIESKQVFIKLTANLKANQVEKGWYEPNPYLLNYINEKALAIQPDEMPSKIITLQNRIQKLQEDLSHQAKRIARLETWYNNCLEREKNPTILPTKKL